VHEYSHNKHTIWVLSVYFDSKLTTKIILYKRKRERERERERENQIQSKKTKPATKSLGRRQCRNRAPKTRRPFFPSDPASVRTGFVCRIRSRIRTTPGRTYICISSLNTYLYCTYFCKIPCIGIIVSGYVLLYGFL